MRSLRQVTDKTISPERDGYRPQRQSTSFSSAEIVHSVFVSAREEVNEK